ncbi:MAG TPA: hypothetical protein ENH59_10530 [Bacteroidetes bacterium]|nr:hypothetical protein [Bacteroidota bacterium]
MDNRDIDIRNYVKRRRSHLRSSNRENMYITLLNDGCEDLFTYINWMNLGDCCNAIVLPATTYFYIPENLDDTEILVNLKPLNLIEDLGCLLSSILDLLPVYSYFTVFLEECKNENKESLKPLLESTGFKVLDITGLNEKTFFCAQKQIICRDAVS